MSDDTSFSLRLVTSPTNEPLTLAQAKTFLRIEHSADDDAIMCAIIAARQAAEHYLRQALLPQTWDFAQANPPPTKARLVFGPARSITSVTQTTEVGATTTMNPANYRLSVGGFAVLFTPYVTVETLTIRYVAGMGAVPTDIPSMIIQGMLHHIMVILENREGEVPMPMQSIACYRPYRRISL